MKKYVWILILMMALSLAGCAKRNSESAATGPEPTTTVAPETVSITFYREGEGTTIAVPMVTGSMGNYRIATNPEIFLMDTEDGSDIFRYTLWEGEPDIYYSVSYYPDTTAQAASSLLNKYSGATSEEVKVGQYDAICVSISDSDRFRSQQHFYLIAHNDGCFVIETQFIMEMYEGLFPQMRAIFNTFVIVD
ncbi:MAG: hypothetical protein ACI3W5_01755 [Faecousia sp.]